MPTVRDTLQELEPQMLPVDHGGAQLSALLVVRRSAPVK